MLNHIMEVKAINILCNGRNNCYSFHKFILAILQRNGISDCLTVILR